jgi:DNA (cytosine-5)-methyltransferase 1
MGAAPLLGGSLCKRLGNDAGMSKPRLLDLFCGAGGAAMGYHRAGFEVVGVDDGPQKHYPFEFIRCDALDYLLSGRGIGTQLHFDAIHASPPCQRFTRFQTSQPQRQNKHLDLITPTRPLLVATGLPWVIENVPGAPLLDPIQLCGSAFGLIARGDRQLIRHRWFECSFGWAETVPPCRHEGRAVMVAGHGKDGYRGSGLAAYEAREAMGIDWMNRDEMAEAVPPAYTEWIGKQLMAALKVAA